MNYRCCRAACLLRTSAAGVSLSLGLLATPAFAQDGAGAETDDSTIIVTATRRSEALSDVPIAVSAVTGDTLEKSGATDVRALGQVAPSLLVSGATSEVNFTARIRGIGTVGENPGLESSVGLFIDGVYRSRTGVGLSELGDIERVEERLITRMTQLPKSPAGFLAPSAASRTLSSGRMPALRPSSNG